VLEQRMRGALDALHAIDLMHCDVREDNVLRVNGEWKLGDLGGVIAVDNPVVANQIDPAYRPSGVKLGDPAAPTHDLDALAVVLEHAAHGLPLSDEAGTV
jgi:serine/threonine protein kinase